ncbi:hypothetical protein FE783_28200 [Paenibacillus mesophilus]|uniref:hypothetical protein n=1 Tax=Paenibacillus mesophilus TaxID=2582849 RepID=UPI00110DFA72|nr:hypothetical protein [Paenibacillus mesophilus]TMV45814.1 hypothetical protein FE783_28200 [Paenibacillus mesophilus]
MQTKLAVQFRKNRRTSHAFERLKTCKKCGGYSVLFDNVCKQCGSRDKFIPVTEYASAMNRIMPWAEAFGAIALVLLAVASAGTLQHLAAAVIGGAAFLFLFFLLRKRYKPYADTYRLHRLLIDHTPAIWRGLRADLQEAVQDMDAAKPKEAYEKLREIGHFLRGEHVKVRKIDCLGRFFIRKDMELELEEIVPASFRQDFVLYLWEAVKVNKRLVRQSVLDYVVAYRYEIAAMEHGKDILTLVAGAALRMKAYVQRYPHFIVDYLDELPRERFHRLCKLMASTPAADRGRLYERCKELAKTRYGFDPEFQGLF